MSLKIILLKLLPHHPGANDSLNLKKTLKILPLCVIYRVSIMSDSQKIDCVTTAPHYIDMIYTPGFQL